MKILAAVFIVILCFLFLVFWKYQRQVRDICRQLSFLKEHDSNMIISGEISFCSLKELAELLNDLLSEQRKARLASAKKEKVIAEIYTSLSHDIRTPLTSLDGYVQLLKKADSPQDQERYLMVIERRIGSLKEMLEELFIFTRLKEEFYHIELTPCDLNRIVKNTIFSYYDDWVEKGLEPKLRITEEPLPMMGNEQALKRVVENVIKNAVDHGEKDIEILLCRQGEEICFKVSNGVMHPEEMDLAQVFERFYKADRARSQNSTGLGLSIAKEFVLHMNGTIRADLDGNIFSIEIRFYQVGKTRGQVLNDLVFK